MLNSMESILNIPESIINIFVGLITITTAYSIYKNNKKQPIYKKQKDKKPINFKQPTLQEPINNYKSELGKRHKNLRENILKLNLRVMAEFYELKSVSILEDYEAGLHELPIKLLQKLENFFFIREEYMSGADNYIFKTFSLSTNSNEADSLITDGFHPTLLCNPNRNDLFAYIVLSKEEQGLRRIIRSDNYGSFMSKGGGKSNIQSIIYAMLKHHISALDISIWKVSTTVWDQLGEGTYYSSNLSFSPVCADHTCSDIFFSWYEEKEKTIKGQQGTLQ